MKRLILILFCSTFFGCNKGQQFRPCNCVPPPYKALLIINIDKIKDPNVKFIKATLKNLDGIEPEFVIYSGFGKGKGYLEKKEEIYSVKEPRDTSGKYFIDGKEYYFANLYLSFLSPKNPKTGKKRTYELKMYINGKLFFTKKLSFTPKENGEGYLYSDNLEVDNMEYVKEIRRDFRPVSNCVIEITDADIKKK